MNIGFNIKKLRRERDITQEQLAEYLNISVSAISQWESGKTTPDISLLVPLANIFDVSADVLLGIDVINKEKQIDDIISRAEKYNRDDTDPDKAVSTLREGLKEYPNSYKIMARLMNDLTMSKKGKTKDETLILTNEIIKLGEKILAECTDDSIRIRASHLLCYAYREADMTEKAIELAEKLPKNGFIDREFLLAQLYEGEKKIKQVQKNMLVSFEKLICSANEFNIFLNSDNKKGEKFGTFTIFTLDEYIIILKKIITLIEVMIEDGNYGYFGMEMYNSCINLAVHYAKKNDFDNVIEYLQHSTDTAIKIDTEYDVFGEYTSLLLRGTPRGLHFIFDESFSTQLVKRMKDTAFDPIREKEAFIEIEEKLGKYAKNR